MFICLRTVDHYKERNRRLEEQAKGHDEEVEAVRKEVKEKEEESKAKDKQVEHTKQVS